MAILNYVKREIVAKIVYYGPGLSGKTLNIQKVHESMDPGNVGELTSLATESDRTLFFDFVPIQLGKIAGLETRFQLFTVPGQVFYNQTRRRVLEDCDGVVFVADSQPEQLDNNVESLNNLEENLAFYGKKLSDIPFVIQFNKQDLPGCMTEEELTKILNKHAAPTIRASCVENFGVMETLAKISTMVLAHLREQMTKKTAPGAPPTGIKRTYSKEGVSDEQVVKNLLEDIANSGAAAEAQAAAGIAPAPPPAAAKAPPPPAPAKPIAPPAGGPPKPLMPRPTGSAPAPIVPGGAPPRPPAPAPAAAAAAGPSLSAEDLLSDLDSPGPSAPTKPAAAPARPPSGAAPVASRPATSPVGPNAKEKISLPPRPPPKPPTTSGPAAATKALDRPSNGSGSGPGLRAVTPPPMKAPVAAAKTAEDLLEDIDRDSNPGLQQETGGSFDTPKGKKKTGNPLWDADDGDEAVSTAMTAKPGIGSVLDDPGGDGDGKTNVANVGAMMKELRNEGPVPGAGGKPENTPPPTGGRKPSGQPPTGIGGALGEDSELQVSSVSNAQRGADGSIEFDVLINDGSREASTRLVIPAAALKGLVSVKGGGGGALALGVINLLFLIGLAVFNVLAFLGVITPP